MSDKVPSLTLARQCNPLPALLILALLWTFTGAAAAQPATPQGEVPAPSTADNAKLLADILRDDQAREALINELLAVAEQGGATEEAAAGERPLEQLPFVQSVAQYTREVAESATASVDAVKAWAIELYQSLFSGDQRALRGLGEAAIPLALLIVSTLAVFYALTLLATAAYRWLAARAATAGWLRKAGLLLGSMLIDALVVLLAWAGGYLIALFAYGPTGQMDINESLYLNAFLIVESTRVLLRGALASRHGELRLVPLSDTSAAYWYFWASRLVALLGYGFLLVAPIVRANFPPRVAHGVELLIGLIALVVAVILVLQNRKTVRSAIAGRSEGGHALRGVRGALGRIWHVLAMLYLLALYMIWSTRREGALSFVLQATGESILALALGGLVMALISRFVTGGMRLPQDIKDRLPLLEPRLNAFVPTVLKVVRPLVGLVVVMLVLQAWALFNFVGWLGSEPGRILVSRLFSVALITVFAFLIWLAISSWVEYRLNPNYGRAFTARERTLLALLRNAATIAIAAVAIMITLSELGVNIGPLLAGAGVLGLAVGFGAQKMVQDIITGVFIQFENAINEGDVVTVAGITGVVDRLTIRSVSLRDLNGTFHIVPFSSVDSVSNFMRGYAFHVAEIGFAYREDTAQTKAVMHRAFDQLEASEEYRSQILGDLEWHGVTQLGDSAVVQRARIKTLPGSQWAVGRAYTEIVKRLCDEAGIEIPYPHTTLYFGEDRDGHAPPMRVSVNEGGRLSTPEPAGTGDSPPADRSLEAPVGKSAPPASPDDDQEGSRS